MNAKEMLARYAQGGMVDESVDVSKARQMLQNLTSPVQHFASGSEVVPEGFRRSLFTGELVPIAATVEQLTDIYRGGEAQQANADAAARAVATAATPVQASPAVSAAPAPAPETRLSLFTNEPVPVNASVQDLTDIYSDYSFPSEPAAPETRLSLFTNEPVPVNASVQDLTNIYSDYSFPSEPAASTVTASPSTVAQNIATLSSGEKQPSTAASDLLDLSKVASPAPGPSAAAVTSATIGEPPTSKGPDAVALASELGIPTFQVVSLLNQGLDASAIRNRYAIPVSVATDLMQRSMTDGVDTSEFDRLGGYERVKEVYDAAGGSYTPPFGQKPVVPPPVPPIVPTPAPSVVLSPPQPLPPLTEEFVAPTAPPPQAPPVALTAGQEGLNPSTAIVGATPIENRVAKVTETAINKIPESERVKIPQLDTEFRASAPRTATYDRFGRVTGYNYSPAAKLTPATGTNVFNFVPPGITSRPRSLLNLGDVPGVTIDPVTGQLTMPLSASQRFARDRAELDNQFRRLYARAAETDTSLPTQAPSTAAAAFRQFAMNDPTMSAQLRMRNIEQTPTVNPTAAMTAARSEFGAAPYAAALTQAFDPFLARNRASLLASKDMQRSYFERYPDLVAEYEKNWSKTMSPEEYAAYHYRTLGQKEGRTPPNLMGSPYTQQFFSKGGEASTEDFIKKQSGGDVSRETASPNTAEVPKLTPEGQLIDENAEMRSESQRMLNRLKTAQQESYHLGFSVL